MDPTTCSPTLTAGLVVDEPYALACYKDWWDTGKCEEGPGPGMEVETMTIVIRGLLKIPNLLFWEAADYTELFDGFANGTFDMFFVSNQINPADVYADYQASTVMDYGRVGLLVKQSIYNKRTSLISAFSYDLWLTIVATLLAIFIFEALYSKYIRPLSARPSHYENRILYSLVAGITLNLICNIYSNMMAITLFTNNAEVVLPIKDMDDLGQKLLAKQCQLVVPDAYNGSSDFWDPLVYPTHEKSWAKAFRDAYDGGHKPLVVADRDTLARQVLQSTATMAYIGVDYDDLVVYYDNKFCDLEIMQFPDDLPLKSYVFYYQNKGCLDGILNDVLESYALTGIVDNHVTKYLATDLKPPCLSKSDNVIRPLNVEQLLEGFQLILCGVALALVVFTYEFAYHQLVMMRLRRIFAKMHWRRLVINHHQGAMVRVL